MTRVPIPPEIAATVMYESHGTCCVCNVPGLYVQVHHIDEDNTNSLDPDNLAVLCLEHHNDTQIRGGFARKLDAAQVRVYRANWIERVRQRRAEADRLAVEAM